MSAIEIQKTVAGKVEAIIHPADEGGYWAEVPQFPGCFSEGETLAEVKENIRDAAEGWLVVQCRHALSKDMFSFTREPRKRRTERRRNFYSGRDPEAEALSPAN